MPQGIIMLWGIRLFKLSANDFDNLPPGIMLFVSLQHCAHGSNSQSKLMSLVNEQNYSA